MTDSVLPVRRRVLHGLIASLLACVPWLLIPPAWAQPDAAYPERPVKIVVPFPPGGAGDAFARLVAHQLTQAWAASYPVVVDNRAGAGGVIGTDLVAKSPADGSTLLLVTIGHAVNPFIYSKLPFDTRADFVPVGVIAQVPSLVVTGPALKGKTLQDLLTMARAKPAALSYASSGTGTSSHVGAALIESMSGTQLLHVPYKGAAPALRDLMADRVALSVDILTSSLPLVKAGKLHGVAITGTQRFAQLPDVPTVAEAGIPGYAFEVWYMLLAPAKTPAPVLDKLNATLRRIAQTADFRARVERLGGRAADMTRPQASDYLNAEFARWSHVVKERHIKAE